VLQHVKEPHRAWVRCFVVKLSQILFLTRDPPASLPDVSGCWIRTIRIMSRQQISHLLHMLTNLGCRTVFTAAWARPGYKATHFYYYYSNLFTRDCSEFKIMLKWPLIQTTYIYLTEDGPEELKQVAVIVIMFNASKTWWFEWHWILFLCVQHNRYIIYMNILKWVVQSKGTLSYRSNKVW
jgi:hypothetical protein